MKILYVKGLQPEISGEIVRDKFAPFGEIEFLNRKKDFAFVHFKEREDALRALEQLNGFEFTPGEPCEVTLAKPLQDIKKKKLHMQMKHQMLLSGVDPSTGPAPPWGGFPPGFPPMPPPPPGVGRGGMRGGRMPTASTTGQIFWFFLVFLSDFWFKFVYGLIFDFFYT